MTTLYHKQKLHGRFVLSLNRVWMPIGIIDWTLAMKLLCKGHAVAIDSKDTFVTYDMDEWIQIHNKAAYDRCVKTVKLNIPVPELIVMKHYDDLPKRNVTFNRENLWVRDDGVCCYCLNELTLNDHTIDHVVPRALGGRTSFLNCVSACRKCNHEKAANPPEGKFFPKKKPREPSSTSLLYHIRKKLDRHNVEYPDVWDRFLFK